MLKRSTHVKYLVDEKNTLKANYECYGQAQTQIFPWNARYGFFVMDSNKGCVLIEIKYDASFV